jgi:hypothetical protein
MNPSDVDNPEGPSQSAENEELLGAVKTVFDRNDPADIAIFLARSRGKSYRSIAEQIADRKAQSPKSLSEVESDCQERANYIYRQLKKMLRERFGIEHDFKRFEDFISEQQGLEFI